MPAGNEILTLWSYELIWWDFLCNWTFKTFKGGQFEKKTMYLLDLSLQHTNINSHTFQLKHDKAKFLIFAEANLPNCGLEFRRSARYLKTFEDFREILQYWWETSSYSAAPDARKLSTIFNEDSSLWITCAIIWSSYDDADTK